MRHIQVSSLPTASEGWGKVMFSVCSHLNGVPTLAGGTYLGWEGVPTLAGGTYLGLEGYLPWPGRGWRVPTLPGGYLPWPGMVPTLAGGYLPWLGVATLWYPPPPG